MDLIPQFLTQLAGGGAAEYADRRLGAKYTKYVGASATDPGVPITPGAMGALAAAALLAVMPGKASGDGAPMWKVLAANATAGALLWESGKLVAGEAIPRIEKALNQPPPGMTATPQAFMAAPGVYGIPQHVPQYGYGPQVSDYELQQSLQQFRQAA